MSEEKEQAAEAVADALLHICSAVVVGELSITDMQSQLQVHPFLADKTGEELEYLDFDIVLSMLTCAVRFMIDERKNEPDRR